MQSGFAELQNTVSLFSLLEHVLPLATLASLVCTAYAILTLCKRGSLVCVRALRLFLEQLSTSAEVSYFLLWASKFAGACTSQQILQVC